MSMHTDSIPLDADLVRGDEWTRLIISDGTARVALKWHADSLESDRGIGLDGGRLVAPDRASANAFIELLSEWLGVAAPTAPAISGAPCGVRYTLQPTPVDGAGRGARADRIDYRLNLYAQPWTSLGLRHDPDISVVEIYETEPERRRDILDGLAEGLRDGPARMETPGGWQIDEAPVVGALERAADRPELEFTVCDGDIVTSGSCDGMTRIRAPDSPELADVKLEGHVAAIAGSPTPAVVAIVVLPGADGSRPQLLIVDMQTGRQRRVAQDPAVIPGARIAWSPDGAYLAVDITSSGGRTVAVVHAEHGRVVQRIPVVGASVVRWSERGVWLREVEPSTPDWFEAHLWDPDSNSLQALSGDTFVSPDGRYEVTSTNERITVRSGGDVEHVLERGSSWPRGPEPQFPATWLDDTQLLLEGIEPMVLDVETATLRYLLPRARVDDVQIVGGRVLCRVDETRLWVGRL
jgi:hypothetical protein